MTCTFAAGIIRRAAEHILAHVNALKEKLKPGEAVGIKVCRKLFSNLDVHALG